MLQSRNIKYFMCCRKPAVIIDNGRPTGKSNASQLPPNVSHLLRFVYKMWFQGNKQSMKLCLWECYTLSTSLLVESTFGRWVVLLDRNYVLNQAEWTLVESNGHTCASKYRFLPLPGETVPFQGYFKDKFHHSPCNFGQHHTAFA